jgi:hypothetical protein
MVIPYTGLFISASCKSRSSRGQVHPVHYDDDVFYVFQQKQKIALGHIPFGYKRTVTVAV